MAQTTLRIGGIECAACAGLIEAAVRPLPGVGQVQVNTATERAQIDWDPTRTPFATILKAIEAAGYSAEAGRRLQGAQARAVERKRLLWRLFVAWFCAMQVMMLATPAYVAAPGEIAPDLQRLMNWAQWFLCLPVMAFSVRPFMEQAWRALRHRRIIMDVPVAVGMIVMFGASSVVAFAPGGWLGTEVVFDSLSMFAAILLAGRWVDMRLRHEAAEAVEKLLDRPAQPVLRLDDDGSVSEVMPAGLRVGDRLRVRRGESFAADAVVMIGRTEVSEALMTGESAPLVREPGQQVLCGSVNLGAPVEVCVTAVGGDTRWSQLVDLAERAALERPALVQMADRWAGPFLWGVMALAVAAGVLWWVIDPARALWVAVAVLVVTCPCALSLAAPAALAAAARGFAREGVLLQRLSAIEDLARVDTVIFDKTGTLTEDRLQVAAIDGPRGEAERLAVLERAASLAAWSQHPAAQAIVRARETAASDSPSTARERWCDVQERPGLGIEALDTQGVRWRLGRPSWVRGEHGGTRPTASGMAPMQLAFGPVGQIAASFELTDSLRADAHQTTQALQASGTAVWLLSGDAEPRVAAVARALQVPMLGAGALPSDKKSALTVLQGEGRVVAMVGDGINDAPVLAQAQVSVAMGHGSSVSVARADLVVQGARLAVLPRVMRRARLAHRIIRQNLWWALAYNLSAIPLALAGWLPPWAAGLGMTLSSLLVVLNSRRAARLPAQAS